ncbi:MAG: hypothetical protein RR224_12425 [Clostridia bacterium]
MNTEKTNPEYFIGCVWEDFSAISYEGDRITAIAIFHPGFETKKGNFVVGIGGFTLAYRDTDHHVRAVGLSIDSVTISGETVYVKISATMHDDGGHYADLTRSKVNVSLFAFPKDTNLSAYGRLATLACVQSFSASYGDCSHHVFLIQVKAGTYAVSDGIATISDTSKHIGTGVAKYEYFDFPAIFSEDIIKSEFGFIWSFAVVGTETDHHVQTFSVNAGHKFELSDKHANRANIGSCSVSSNVII